MTPRQVLDLLKIDYMERPNRLAFCCPFHDDTEPSTGFYEDTELCYCFSCDHTLDPISFYAKYQGIKYGEARRDLEKRFGERKFRDDKGNKLKNDKGRLTVERALNMARRALSMQTFAELGELADRVLLLHERGNRLDSDLDTDLEMWYNSVEEATNAAINLSSIADRTPTVGSYGRLKERLADLSGPGRSDGEIDLD